jgi:hypothetical protein
VIKNRAAIDAINTIINKVVFSKSLVNSFTGFQFCNQELSAA